MRQVSTRHIVLIVAFSLFAAVPLLAYGADTATIHGVSGMPSCMTPGQVVTVSVDVANTGTEMWHTGSPADPAACPPGQPPADRAPATAPDCRHSVGYKMNGGAIK